MLYKMNTGSAFVGGLLLGALTVALFTPKRGSEIREVAKTQAETALNKIRKAKDGVEDKSNQLKKSAAQSLEATSRKIARKENTNS